MSLRARVALVTAVAVTVVVVASTLVLGRLVAADARVRLDTRLAQQAQALDDVARRLVGRPVATEIFTRTSIAEDLTLGASITLTTDDTTLLRLGTGPPADPAEPDGLATVAHDGQPWRRHTTTITTPRGQARLQVAAPMATVEDTIAAVQRRSRLVGLTAITLAAVTAWWLAGRATRPVDRLTATADRVASSGDLTVRVPDAPQPSELAALARSINGMLDRLETAAADREQALASSRAFAADVAHELRTPLTSILANLDLVTDHPDMPDTERSQRLGAAHRELHRLTRTLDALHTLAQADVAEPADTPVDLAETIDAAVQRTHAGDARIDLDLPEHPVEITGNPEALELIVDNLLRNALTHGHRPGQPARIRLRLTTDPDHAVLTIDDHGPGLGPDPHRLLDRFTRGTTDTPGTGLGLAIVARLVQTHHGTIQLDDHPQGGAHITMRLPRNRPAADAAHRHGSSEGSRPRRIGRGSV